MERHGTERDDKGQLWIGTTCLDSSSPSFRPVIVGGVGRRNGRLGSSAVDAALFFRTENFVHEGDVGDSQFEGLDARQPFLVGKGGHLHKDTRLQS